MLSNVNNKRNGGKDMQEAREEEEEEEEEENGLNLYLITATNTEVRYELPT